MKKLMPNLELNFGNRQQIGLVLVMQEARMVIVSLLGTHRDGETPISGTEAHDAWLRQAVNSLPP
jgi:hypothetical protein